MVTIGVIKLSEYSRQILLKVFMILSIVLASISFMLLSNSIYVTFVISPNLHSEKAVIRLIFTIIGMLAMQLTIYYTAGIFVCRKCHTEAYKKNARYLLRIWTFSGYSSILNIIIIGTMAAGVSNHIVRSMHHSMIRGMKRYLKDINWKKIIDSLQYRLHCCGSKKYTDWHEISWISTYHIIKESLPVVENCRLNGDRVYLPAVPWSCCRLDNHQQCFHDPIQQYQYTHNWTGLSSTSVYNIGCVEILRQPIENTFLVFILFTYVLFILQVILSIISRYLYTSFRNSIVLGDPFGDAPGWIIGENAFEIMNGISPNSTTIYTEESTYNSAKDPSKLVKFTKKCLCGKRKEDKETETDW